MIKHLWYVRHGQSTANAAGVYGGSNPSLELTVLGREQAATAGELLRGVPITRMIASPLLRARDTAAIIADVIGFDPAAITYDDHLRELDSGQLTGTRDVGFTAYMEYLAEGSDPTAESPEDVALRLHQFFYDLAKNPDLKGQTVLIVAHAGVGRVMRSQLTGVPMSNLATLDVPNAQPFELPIDRIAEVAMPTSHRHGEDHKDAR